MGIDNHVYAYLLQLHRRVIKILHMNDEQSQTIDKYIDSLARELIGNSEIFCKDELLTIVGKIKGLELSSKSKTRKDVLDACNLVEKMQKRYEWC